LGRDLVGYSSRGKLPDDIREIGTRFSSALGDCLRKLAPDLEDSRFLKLFPKSREVIIAQGIQGDCAFSLIRSSADLRKRLSPRERQIVPLAAQGLSNKGIAFKIGIDETTVKTHLGRIFSKLGISSRAKLAHLSIFLQNDDDPPVIVN